MEREWMLPGEPPAVRLMATVWADAEGRHDELGSPSDVDEWLDSVGADRGGAATTPAEFRRVRALRDSLRRLAALVTSDDRLDSAAVRRDIAIVNAAVADVPVERLTLIGDSLRLTTEATVRGAVALVAAEGQRLLADRNGNLRACHAPGCVLFFVRTHHRREWCSVTCGNRVRAARHYRRAREGA